MKEPFREYARASLVSTEYDAALGACVTDGCRAVAAKNGLRPSLWLRASHAANHDTIVPSQTINRATDSQRPSIEDVEVNHRRGDVRMPEQFLHGADVVPVLE